MPPEPASSVTRRALLLALAVLLVDQASKAWLIAWLQGIGGYREVTGFFNLVMVWNRGISFGLFQSGDTGRYVLAGFAVAVSIGLLVWLRRGQPPLTALGIGAVLGGAIGNVVDRLFRGAVADFFDFHIFGYHWPAFNVADSAITLGVVAILVDGLRGSSDSAKSAEEARERTVD